MASEWEKNRARSLLTLGRLLSQLGEFECAIELLQKAVSLKPDMVEARVEMGIAMMQTEDYEDMIKIFKEAIQLDQRAVRAAIHKYPDGTDLRDQILYPQDTEIKTQNVIKVLELPIEFEEAGALVSLASHHLSTGHDEDAVTALVHSIKLDSASWLPMVMLNVAYLLLECRGMLQAASSVESTLWEFAPELASRVFSH